MKPWSIGKLLVGIVLVGTSQSWAEMALLLTPNSLGDYSVTEIGNDLVPYGINDHGRVVGYVGPQSYQPFVWSPSEGLTILAPYGTDPTAVAYGINNSNVIVGSSYRESYNLGRAVLWLPSGDMQDLGTLGGEGAYADAINERGQVVGGSNPPGSHGFQPFLWDSIGGMRWIGPVEDGSSFARDISDSGQVVGARHGVASMWTEPSGLISLGKLGPSDIGSQATAINNLGQVVGWSRGDAVDRAFIWTLAAGMQELDAPPGHASALAINDWGTIVGWSGPLDDPHAIVWRDGIAMDLNNLLSSDIDYRLLIARGINNEGQIIATGYIVPIPAPCAMLLALAGVGLVGWMRRRDSLWGLANRQSS